ncbi:MAG: acyl-CoA dehydrogenase family protein, partial [Burkholderiales bacterium]
MFNLHLTEEQKAIRETVRNFVRKEVKPIACERDRLENFDQRFPWEVIDKASELGLRTLLLSTENGGAGI